MGLFLWFGGMKFDGEGMVPIQSHIAATTINDMIRTYDLIYAIRKRLVCKDILETGT
jgi:hypothetical protein